MKLFTVLLSASLLSATCILDSVKTKWKQEMYYEVSQKDFRTNALFNRPINLKKPDIARLNAAIFYVTNEKRQEHFLPLLRHRSHLEDMASDHSSEMIKSEFFSHTHPKDKSKRKTIDRALKANIPNPYVAENIYFTGGVKFASYLQLADSIVQALMESPAHKANILNKAAIELGCGSGYTHGSWRNQKRKGRLIKGFWLVTQNFQFYQPIASIDD